MDKLKKLDLSDIYILLSLRSEKAKTYLSASAISRIIAFNSEKAPKIKRSAYTKRVKNLVKHGLIAESKLRAGKEKAYYLTPEGQKMCETEKNFEEIMLKINADMDLLSEKEKQNNSPPPPSAVE